MLLAVAGIPILRKRLPAFFLPVLLLLLSMIYVQSSWWSWWFGGGFGLRAYIDMYGVMAIPLAVMVEIILVKSRRFIRVPGIILIIALVAFQLLNTYQYRKNIIHFAGMNREVYWKGFFRLKRPAGYWDMLTMPDYRLAREGIYVSYYTGDQYREIAGLDPGQGMERVREMIREDPGLMRQIGRYARRQKINMEEAVSRVAERMYFRMTQ
jgi:hypothetical protein